MPLILRPPGRRESLPDTLADLGRGRRSVAVAAGVFLAVGVGIAAGVLAGLVDVLADLPPLARGFALVGTLALVGVTWLRRVSPARRLPTDALSVALELERRFPQFNDALASGVAFAAGGNRPMGESAPLRRAVV